MRTKVTFSRKNELGPEDDVNGRIYFIGNREDDDDAGEIYLDGKRFGETVNRKYVQTTDTVQGNMGYLVLKKNQDFKTQVEDVSEGNTIFEIRYDYDLGGQTVTIPENCVLKFEGGSISNGTVVGNNSTIKSDNVIFDNVVFGGTWYNVAAGGVVVRADVVYDYTQGKSQKDVNTELIQSEETLKALYMALTQSDVVVGALPSASAAEVNTIYRVPGTTDYTDYMYDGTQFVAMATYNNAIDDVCTGKSSNLVKNEAVFKRISESLYKEATVSCMDYGHFSQLDWTGTGYIASALGIGDIVAISSSNSYRYWKIALPNNAVAVVATVYLYSATMGHLTFTDTDGVIIARVSNNETTTQDSLGIIYSLIPKGSVHLWVVSRFVSTAAMANVYVEIKVPKEEPLVGYDFVVDSTTKTVRKRTVLSGFSHPYVIRYNSSNPAWRGFYNSGTYRSFIFDVRSYSGKKVYIENVGSYGNGKPIVFAVDYTQIFVTTGNTPYDGDNVQGWTGNVVIPSSTTQPITIPDNVNWLIVCMHYNTFPKAYILDYDTTDDIVFKSDLDQATGTLQNSISQVANEVWTVIDGSVSLTQDSIKSGKLVRTTRLKGYGLWMNRNNFNSYIYDVSGYQTGETIQIAGATISNYYAYIFLKSITLSTEEDWNAAYDSEWNSSAKYNKQSSSAQRFSLTVKKPAGALYLVVASYLDTIIPSVGVQVNKQSVYERLNILEGDDSGISEKEWVTSERERIEGLVNSLITHNLVVFGFNTDQHISKSNREAVLRGLGALVKMAERLNFDAIVIGGDDTYASDDTIDKIIADIQDVNKASQTNVCPVISVVGNHEGEQNARVYVDGINSWNAFSTYRYKTQRLVSKRQVVWAAPVGANYIVDDDIKKCRFIVVDQWSKMKTPTSYITSGHNTDGSLVYTDEAHWVYYFKEVLEVGLSDSKLFNSDWKVYLFSHSVCAPAVEGDVQNVTAPVFGNSESFWNSTIETAQANGVNIVMGVNGHTHNVGWRSNHGILFCSTGSASQKNTSTNNVDKMYYEHDENTPTESLFDVYVHDITDNKVYAFAYGAPSDRIWDVSGTPELLLDNLTVTFDTQHSLVGAKAYARYHNTEFEVVADSEGHFHFPYLTPDRKWLISIVLDGSDEGIDNYEYTAVAGTHTKTLPEE